MPMCMFNNAETNFAIYIEKFIFMYIKITMYLYINYVRLSF